jgi:hypothetical protein
MDGDTERGAQAVAGKVAAWLHGLDVDVAA